MCPPSIPALRSCSLHSHVFSFATGTSWSQALSAWPQYALLHMYRLDLIFTVPRFLAPFFYRNASTNRGLMVYSVAPSTVTVLTHRTFLSLLRCSYTPLKHAHTPIPAHTCAPTLVITLRFLCFSACAATSYSRLRSALCITYRLHLGVSLHLRFFLWIFRLLSLACARLFRPGPFMCCGSLHARVVWLRSYLRVFFSFRKLFSIPLRSYTCILPFLWRAALTAFCLSSGAYVSSSAFSHATLTPSLQLDFISFFSSVEAIHQICFGGCLHFSYVSFLVSHDL